MLHLQLYKVLLEIYLLGFIHMMGIRSNRSLGYCSASNPLWREIDRCLLEVKRNLHLRNCDLDIGTIQERTRDMQGKNVKTKPSKRQWRIEKNRRKLWKGNVLNSGQISITATLKVMSIRGRHYAVIFDHHNTLGPIQFLFHRWRVETQRGWVLLHSNSVRIQT